MAGKVPPTSIGVGSALRRARTIRQVTIDDAVRDTRLPAAQLRALEEEDFEAFGGEVYARATLRTYAQYLGLDPDKVVRAYARHAEERPPPSPPGKMGRVERAIAATRVRDNQRFLLIAAVVVLMALIAVGLVSRRGAPPPDPLATVTAPSAPPGSVATTEIDVALTATEEVTASAIADGEPFEAVTLRAGEVISYSAVQELVVEVSDGGLVSLSVAGEDRGTPGTFGQPWTQTFTVADMPASAPEPTSSPEPT
jgi:cytoskeleton protein RodZ